MDFPCHVFKSPGPYPAKGGKTYGVCTAADADQHASLLAAGWHATRDEAFGIKPAAEHVADDAPPTRAELEQKATELGLKFDGRWGDKRLAEAIAAKLG